MRAIGKIKHAWAGNHVWMPAFQRGISCPQCHATVPLATRNSTSAQSWTMRACDSNAMQHLMHAFSHTGPLHACIQSHYFVRSPSRRFLLHLRHLPLWASRARKQRDILQTHPQLHTFMHAWINQFGPCLVSQCSWRFHRCSLRLPNMHACTNENITCMHDSSFHELS